MKTNKISLAKYLIILGVMFWCLPALADELPTDITSSTPEIQLTSTTPETIPPVVASSTLIIRYQDQIVWTGSINLTTAIYHDEINGVDYPLNANNVFSALVLADQQSEAFTISDAQYNADYNSFYLACITIASPAQNACYNWNYVVNNIYPSMGMDSYNLTGGETIYIYFSNPWQITATTTTFPADTTTTFQTWRYQFDNLLEPWILE